VALFVNTGLQAGVSGVNDSSRFNGFFSRLMKAVETAEPPVN
jgi:hypothetical protein